MVGFWGALFFILSFLLVEVTELPRQLMVAVFPLLFAGYVVLALRGATVILVFLLVAAAMIVLSLLPSQSPKMGVVIAQIVVTPFILLLAACVGRLQFVRGCSHDLRYWPQR